MVQIAVPSSDISVGQWVTAPLWSDIDDATGQIQSDDNTNGNSGTCTLTSVTDPTVHTGHDVKYTIRKEATGGHSVNFRIELIQGVSNVIAQFNQGAFDVATFTDFTSTLSTAQAANISDYTDLRIRFDRLGDTGGRPATRRWIELQKCSLEVPDAGPPLVVEGQRGASGIEAGHIHDDAGISGLHNIENGFIS